jgi:predicted  nucleic acid-binding Zn-ribbon protein
MAAAIRTRSGEDPFSKVKALIKDMIERLLDDGQKEASHKAYCDKEMGETASKKADKEAKVEKLTASIDEKRSRSAELKSQVADLQKALAKLASSQSEMNKIRSEEKATFKKNSADMEQGLEGVKMALRILRDYYAQEDAAHDTADGAGSGVVGMLEVVESDFTKGLAEMKVAEMTAENEYKQQTQANEIEKATKGQDVKYKTKEYKGLNNAVAELTSDRGNVQEELSAVYEYSEKLVQMCVSKAESYSERSARREAEIAGLKQALEILANEASLIQKSTMLRGIQRVM